VTVLEVIQRSSEYLARKGVASPRRNAEELLAHVLKLPRLQLYLNFERQLAKEEEDASRTLVMRRGQREPLQHIVGSVCFCGLDLEVSRQVLVPRPESELLAEHAWQHLASLPASSATALDLGTGSGCLAIALAVKAPQAQIHATDISAAALEVARRNAARHQGAEGIHFHCGDGFGPLPASLRFDLVVSNPPYISTAEIETLESEVRDFDPRAALDGGADGLDFYRRLARETAGWIKPGGRIMLEIGDGQADAIRELFLAQKWVVEGVLDDYSPRPRVLVARYSHESSSAQG
jgi:release factor glutamine methyltransferase